MCIKDNFPYEIRSLINIRVSLVSPVNNRKSATVFLLNLNLTFPTF